MGSLITNAALLNVTAQGPVLAAGSIADVPFAIGMARSMTNVYAVSTNTAWFSTNEPASASTFYIANVPADAGPGTELLAVQKVVN